VKTSRLKQEEYFGGSKFIKVYKEIKSIEAWWKID
jgi:hypothetical protein